MHKHFRYGGILKLLGLSILGALAATTLVAIRHLLNTPQPLDSILPGEARLYRWKHGHIFYKVLGAENAPPLVLVHDVGIGASSYEMRNIMEPLARHYRVYALDLLGFGLSDRPAIDYSAEIYTSLCHDFLNEDVAPAIWQGQATAPPGTHITLLASGMACDYAIAAAQTSLDLCQGLVLISPNLLAQDSQAASQTQSIGSILRASYPQKLLAIPLVKSFLFSLLVWATLTVDRRTNREARLIVSSYRMGRDIDYLYATTHRFGAEHAPMALLAGNLTHGEASGRTDRHQVLPLQQPTLIIYGANALNSAGQGQAIAPTYPNGEMAGRYQALPLQVSACELPSHTQLKLIPDAGRHVHEEHPAAVVSIIHTWSTERHDSEALSPAIQNGTNSTSLENEEVSSFHQALPLQTTSSTGDIQSSALLPTEDEQDTSAQPLRVEAYCVKCKTKTQVQDLHEVTMKNGNPAIRGTCSVCGTNVFRIGRLVPETH